MEVRDATSVGELLRPVSRFLEADGVTELCINRPGEIFLEGRSGWTRFEVDQLSERWAYSLAVAVASYGSQPLSSQTPFLCARLPGGERIQAVIPPACAQGIVVVSIRRPCQDRPSLEDFAQQGVFDRVSPEACQQSNDDTALMALLRAGELKRFFQLAVQARKNIAIVGDTGSGKTTLMRALCELIEPAQRVVTIEDTHELDSIHANCVNLFFNDSLGIPPASCLRAALRLRPDRVMLAELRGPEAFDFLNVLMTGHSGSITSFHADSCAMALERLAIMAGAHEAARAYSDTTLMRLARSTIDVIAHLSRTPGGRRLSAVHFDPATRSRLATSRAPDWRDARASATL
jgi:type IV secretion system protein VirB11